MTSTSTRPLECPKCQGFMPIIALIDDPRVIRRILEILAPRLFPAPTGTLAPRVRLIYY